MRVQQLDHITGDGAVVISGGRARTVPKPPHVWRDHSIFRREFRNHVAPAVRGMWPTVEQDDNIAITFFQIVKLYLREL
jgi:hypothetical protein